LKIKGSVECPNCNKKHDAELDIDKLTMEQVKTAEIKNPQDSGTSTVLETKPEVKPEPKILPPIHVPAFKCTGSDCGEIHKNPNYFKRVKGKCKNCDQFSRDKEGDCPWCREKNSIEEIDDDELDELGIPKPLEREIGEGHGH